MSDMITRHLLVSAGLALAVVAAPSASYAQGAGGGSGSSVTGQSASAGPDPAPCIQRGPDGKPVRKMSSEEVCPMIQFFREDCRRDGAMGLTLAEEHCSLGALGLRREEPVATGSIGPASE